MNCKKSLMTLGKEWKWVMLLGHNDGQIEEAQCPAPQTIRKRVESGNNSMKVHELLAWQFTLFKKL